MRELVVLSGKGGTGKTSITAALAALAKPVVLADCDVDVPDLALLADPKVHRTHAFSSARKARVKTDDCCGCGRCAAICRFNAVGEAPGNDVVSMTYAVDAALCEGCGACVVVCPAKAVQLEPIVNGAWFVSTTRFGPMVHARINPGGENSGKLVATVRNEARRLATERNLPLVLIDGSPGVGCPVIASLTGVDAALVVAEPTPAGMHDALRVMRLARQMRVPTALCMNRADLSPAHADELSAVAGRDGSPCIGRIREDAAVVDAQRRGLSVVEWSASSAADDVRLLYAQLDQRRWLDNTRQPTTQQRST